MRTPFLRALAQPIEDIKVAAGRLERFHEPVVFVRKVEAAFDTAERVLETASLGLALVELYVRARDREGEP